MSWHETPLTRLLGVQLPILQAAMAGGPSTPRLAAAVSEAGGSAARNPAFPTPWRVINGNATIPDGWHSGDGQDPEKCRALLEGKIRVGTR